jgi:hypothetical protein
MRIDHDYQQMHTFEKGSVFLNADYDKNEPVTVENPLYFTPGRFYDHGVYELEEYRDDIYGGDFIMLDASGNPISGSTLSVQDSIGNQVAILDPSLVIDGFLYDEVVKNRRNDKVLSLEENLIAIDTKSAEKITQNYKHNYALEMVESYLDAVQFTEEEDLLETLDDTVQWEFNPDAKHVALKACELFVKFIPVDIIEDYTPSQMGHDFWLTRNGHGSGFWDRDGHDNNKEALTDLAKAFGTSEAYINDHDNTISLED